MKNYKTFFIASLIFLNSTSIIGCKDIEPGVTYTSPRISRLELACEDGFEDLNKCIIVGQTLLGTKVSINISSDKRQYNIQFVTADNDIFNWGYTQIANNIYESNSPRSDCKKCRIVESLATGEITIYGPVEDNCGETYAISIKNLE